MVELFREGGVVMFFILGFGVLSLAVAAAHAVRPGEARAAFFRAASRATSFAALTGTLAGISTVFHVVPKSPEWAHSPDLALIVMTGLGESLANALLGFGLLALAWLLFAFGERRALQE
jgi:hypothetical protein